MFRHTLVHLDDTPENSTCQDIAVQFTKNYGGRLMGLYLRVNPQDADSADEAGAFEARENQRQGMAVGPFLARATAAKIVASYEVCTGTLGEALDSAGRAADLVVMANQGAEPSVLLSEAAQLVRSGRRPFLLVGEEARRVTRVGVAFDGSCGSFRALRLAADIAVGWIDPINPIYLITATGSESEVPHLESARAYLDSYGLILCQQVLPGAPIARIAEAAKELDIDLLCSGAYGHSFLRDVLFGSTTQDLIAGWRRSLLISH